MLTNRIPCPQRQGILVLFSHLIVRIEFSEQFAVGLGKAIVVYFADVDLSGTRVGMAKPFRDNREFSILGIHHTGPGVAADVRRQTEVRKTCHRGQLLQAPIIAIQLRLVFLVSYVRVERSKQADCHLNQDAAAQQLLYDVTSIYDKAYTKSTKTGNDLLEEVKLYRRFDLWGEGHNYFDYKRWGEPIVRKAYSAGGSFHTTFAITIKPEDGNNWTWAIPNKESDYNADIN